MKLAGPHAWEQPKDRAVTLAVLREAFVSRHIYKFNYIGWAVGITGFIALWLGLLSL